MKLPVQVASALAVTVFPVIAAAQIASNITTFVVPYQLNNGSRELLSMVVECGLFVNQRLVSTGLQEVNVAPGGTTGSASIDMHWPLRENPSRINRFACQVVPSTPNRPIVSVAGDPGWFALPHAGPRHYVSGTWPR